MKYARTTAGAVLALMIVAVIATTNMPTNHASQDNENPMTRTGAGGISTAGLTSQRSDENPNPGPTPTPLPLPIGVEAWHDAGFNGSGVKVGIIDSSFADIGTHLTAAELARTHALCFRAATEDDDTTDRYVTDNVLANCEVDAGRQNDDNADHGTRVARILLDTAPMVTIYISNTPDPEGVSRATEWMRQSGVKIINASIVDQWDGPGDGTAERGHPNEYPLIVSSNLAIASDIVWVAGAGNGAPQSWFTDELAFVDNKVQFDKMATENGDCNMATTTAGQYEEFTIRWQDNWPSSQNPTPRATDLEIRLRPMEGNPPAPGDALRPTAPHYTEPDAETATKYPRVVTGFNPRTSGNHCLQIVRTSGGDDETPEWLQLRRLRRANQPRGLSPANHMYSIDNPAESTNEGLLAVGGSHVTRDAIWHSSGRGPLPASDKTKPDVVAIQTSYLPVEPYEEHGTSFAAPRVAGMVALVRQALGNHSRFNEPAEVANYIRRHAQYPISNPDAKRWGHGLATLPDANNPGPLLYRPVGGRKTDLELDANPIRTAQGTQGQEYEFQIMVAEDDAMRMVRHGISNALVLVIQDLAQGLNYHARVRDCTDEGGRRICGAWSNYSDPAFVPIGVDVPRDFRAIPGNGFVTLQWRVERSATEYEIDYPAMKSILTAEHHYTVVPNLLNGTNYTFRVRAKRPGDISAWSDPMTVIPTEVELARPTFPRATGWTRGRTLLRWIEVENAVSYQIQRWDGERDRARWVAMSGLTGQQNQAKVFMGNLAWVAGLEEGTEYSHRIRAVNGAERSPWTGWLAATTLGAAPPDDGADPPSTPPPPKMPPSELSAHQVEDGIQLTWTGHTNPNYTVQRVLRRVPGERPIDWTVLPVALSATSYLNRSQGETRIMDR